MLYNKKIFISCFPYRKKYWFKNFINIPMYFKRIHHLVKNGYDDLANWEIYSWFETTMYDILLNYKKHNNGIPIIIDNYDDSKFEENNKAWNEIIDKMIFLLKEMNEDTCSKNNPYDEEWEKAWSDFTEKYGMFGEGLRSEKERAEEKENGIYTMHMIDELDEYKDIDEKHFNAEREIEAYRALCKDEFLRMFSNYYYNLWD